MGPIDQSNGDEGQGTDPHPHNLPPDKLDTQEMREEIANLQRESRIVHDRLGPSQKSRQRSVSVARGMIWGTKASSAALQFVVPPGLGVWFDHRFQTNPIGLIAGAILGFALGMRGLMLLVKAMEQKPTDQNN